MIFVDCRFQRSHPSPPLCASEQRTKTVIDADTDRTDSFETTGMRSKAKKASTQRWGKGSKAVKPPQEKRNLRIELLWLLPALVLGFLVYANALRGDFVLDDQLQILRNTLIQDGSQYWRALTSDVWKGFG